MSDIVQIPDPAARNTALRSTLEKYSLPTATSQFEKIFASSNVSIVKPLFGTAVAFCVDKCTDQRVFSISLCEFLISIAAKHSSLNLNEELVDAYSLMADHAQSEDRIRDAMNWMLKIPVEPGIKSADPSYQLELHTNIATLSIQLHELQTAERSIEKARVALRTVDKIKHADVVGTFYAIHGEIADLMRKYTEAATRFYTAALYLQNVEARRSVLVKCIVCVILSDPGPQRFRLLSSLSKDERCQPLGDLFLVLQKVHQARVLRPKDVSAIDSFFRDHQRAYAANGRSGVQNAIVQHNLAAASHVYYNISFSELGSLLGLDAEEAENISRQMIFEGRLRASIDQVDEVINFYSDPAAPLNQWDSEISSCCNTVNALADDICAAHPQFSAVLR